MPRFKEYMAKIISTNHSHYKDDLGRVHLPKGYERITCIYFNGHEKDDVWKQINELEKELTHKIEVKKRFNFRCINGKLTWDDVLEWGN